MRKTVTWRKGITSLQVAGWELVLLDGPSVLGQNVPQQLLPLELDLIHCIVITLWVMLALLSFIGDGRVLGTVADAEAPPQALDGDDVGHGGGEYVLTYVGVRY